MGNRSEAEQRAHPRYNVYLDALLTGEGLESKACKIRDFCVGGMFLAFEGPTGEITYSSQTPIRAGDVVDIHFYLPVEGRDRPHEIKARVARVLTAGLGVAFVGEQPDVLEALMRVARSDQPADARVDRTGGLDAAEKDRLGQLTRSWFKQDMGGWFSALFRKAEDGLFLASREASDSLAQRRFWDAIAVLKASRQKVEREITTNLLEQFDQLGAKLAGSKPAKPLEAPGSELSLVNTREFEDFLVISETVDKAETLYKAQSYELQQRLSFVFGIRIDRVNNPIGAGVISRAFCDALHGAGLDPDAFRVVVQAFSDGVVPNFSRLYERLNDELKKEGVPLMEQPPKPAVPKLRRSPPPVQAAPAQVAPAAPPPMPAAPVATPVPGLPELFDPEATNGMVPGAAQIYRQHAAQAGAAPAASAGGFQPVAPAGSGAVAAPAASAPGAAAGAYGVAPAAPAFTAAPGAAVWSAPGTVQTAHTLLGLRRQLRAEVPPGSAAGMPAAAGAGPYAVAPAGTQPGAIPVAGTAPGELPPIDTTLAETVTYFHPHEIAAAMRSVDPVPMERTMGLDPASYREKLEDVLSAQSGGEERKAISDQDWDVLELVVELFNAMLGDSRVISDVKPLLRRLRTPVNQLALAEPAFLEDREHPGRRLLNRLSELRSLGGKDPTNSLRPRIEQIVNRVAAESTARPAVFSEAVSELDGIVAEQEREFAENLGQLAKASEEQQQFLKARRKRDGVESRHAGPAAGLSEEWAEWLTRARRLKVGDELEIGEGDAKRRVSVAWVGEDNSAYVLADTIGHKVASVGLQELAMQLRRGSARMFGKTEMPAVDRALFTSLQSLHGKLETEASSDELTGVLNSKAFEEAVEDAIVQAQRDAFHHVLAVLCLDQFEELGGAQSAEAGNALLKETARRLFAALGDDAVIGRVSEHYFGLLFTDSSQGQGYERVERARAAIAAVPWQGADGPLTASAGIVPFGDDAPSEEYLLGVADNAMQLARKAGGNTVRLHHVEAPETAIAKSREILAEQLERALAEDKLQLAVQRVVPQREDAGLPLHVELSAAMQLDAGVRVEPVALRRTAEARKKSLELDRWLTRAAMRWIVEHPDSLPADGWCILKLSPASLNDAGLASHIVDELMNTAVPPSRLCFELTDTSNLDRRSDVDELVHSLREFGCHFAIGDFGNEQSSFAGVKDLRADLVKIGRMDHRNIARSATDVALVRSVVEMAHFLGTPVWADHIDNGTTLARLADLHVEYAQGAAVSPIEVLT